MGAIRNLQPDYGEDLKQALESLDDIFKTMRESPKMQMMKKLSHRGGTGESGGNTEDSSRIPLKSRKQQIVDETNLENVLADLDTVLDVVTNNEETVELRMLRKTVGSLVTAWEIVRRTDEYEEAFVNLLVAEEVLAALAKLLLNNVSR